MLRDAPAGAAHNMALDCALLTHSSSPALRLYGFAPHAVSLGFFQRLGDFADLPAGTPLVRRPTGGGAIHHGDELTFALVLEPRALPGTVDDGYRLLHDAVVVALRSVGVACERLRTGVAAHARPEQRWCFAAPVRHDIVTSGGKLVGSAQRRTAHPTPRLLHHGSIVLRRPELTPFVAAVEDLVAVDAALRARLGDALVRSFAEVLGLSPRTDAATPAETALAAQLRRERFEHPDDLARR